MDRRRTALLVDRDARCRFVLRTALSQRGFRVIAARSRAEALDVMAGETRTPDLVLLDDPDASGAYRVVERPGHHEMEVRLLARPTCVGDILNAVEEITAERLLA